MHTIFATILLISTIIASCSSASHNIFSKKTPHEKYAEKLDDNDLDKTPEGRQWLAVSKSSLVNTHTISLPHKQLGYFASDKARALGLKFTARHGEKLTFTINKKSPFVLYLDLFKEGVIEPDLLLSADTSATEFSFEIDEAGSYLLRLQPELFRSGAYSLSVSVGPSLTFPVAGTNARIGSFWGAGRDGGKRRHEGIDIFAPKSTPVVAGADGVVTGVKETIVGGKVVWLRVLNKNVTLYYAHLSEQLVTEGQLLKKGETVGLVGNTGNAKTTPSHLHFGVYTYAGPIDPHPFVNKNIKTAGTVPEKNLKGHLQVVKAQKIDNGKETIKVNTMLVPLAVTSKGYISELADGRIIQVPFTAVKMVPVEKTEKGIAGKKNKFSTKAG